MDLYMPLPIELVLHVVTGLLPKYPNVILTPSHPITQTLYSFTLVCHETRKLANRYLRQHCVYLSSRARLQSFVLAVPTRPDLRNITALFLAPFTDEVEHQPDVAIMMSELFGYTCSTLKRLVIDMDLGHFDAVALRGDLQKVLQEGFEKLENLEEFVSIRDDLHIITPQYEGEAFALFWKRWTKLRRLALCEAEADSEFWTYVAELPHLGTLILTRANQLGTWNMKAEFFRHTDRPLKVLLVDVEEDQIRFGNMRRAHWDAVDPDRKMTIMTYTIPRIFEDDSIREVCHGFIRTGAENGTLWDWTGELIQHLPKIPAVASRTNPS
ncbi:hypothetical protein BDV95DRAFT_205267 [Massariosphaeria phaeospora]|uniref:F-box domain-containing protein n=1 Tax=Massariosphaeria phaeospora TaxID=100035 RepID=A0A7C8M8M5_9PLEO|nr:hypothetical protein BDV95DRAFT_205267 [Massariosphaeria phaeospora]